MLGNSPISDVPISALPEASVSDRVYELICLVLHINPLTEITFDLDSSSCR